jgi:LysM repeat protein
MHPPEHDEFDEFDDEDLPPDSARPSVIAFRGSIVALLVGTFVTAFLLIRPPEEKSKADVVRVVPTATPTAAVSATATPTRPGGQPTAQTPTTVATAPTVASTETPAAATASPSPVASPTAAERTYTVKSGDTLSGIAAQHGTTVEAILALNPGVEPGALQIGAVLKIPPAQ